MNRLPRLLFASLVIVLSVGLWMAQSTQEVFAADPDVETGRWFTYDGTTTDWAIATKRSKGC